MASTCLVTGGAGFIGSNLVRGLLERGHRARVFDDFSTGRKINLEDIQDDIQIVVGDIRDRAALDTALRGVDVIFHLGAMPSVIRSVKDPVSANDVNINGTLSVLMAARDAGVKRVVFSSSSSVYGDTPVLPKREDMLPQPKSPYALHKLTGEHYCRIFYELYGLETFSLRYFNVFGPRQDPASHYAAVIPLFVKALVADTAPTIFGDGEQTRDFTFVSDVVKGNVCCMTAPSSSAGQAYNIARGDRISVNRLAREIAALMGKDIEPVYEPVRAGDVRDSQADSALARKQIGWTPDVTFEDGLKITVDWFARTF